MIYLCALRLENKPRWTHETDPRDRKERLGDPPGPSTSQGPHGNPPKILWDALRPPGDLPGTSLDILRWSPGRPRNIPGCTGKSSDVPKPSWDVLRIRPGDVHGCLGTSRHALGTILGHARDAHGTLFHHPNAPRIAPCVDSVCPLGSMYGRRINVGGGVRTNTRQWHCRKQRRTTPTPGHLQGPAGAS